MTMEAISLKECKKYLQRFDITECAHEVGISPRQASNVMAGRSVNWSFAAKIIERAERNKALKEKAQSF